MLPANILISFLMTVTPLLIEAQSKVIFIIPRQVRRVHNSGSPMPWRQFLRQPYARPSNFIGNEILPSQSQSRPSYVQHYQSKNRPPVYNKNVPHGGDEFNHGHENMDHMMVSHGKKFTHAINFGKGYLPHEALMQHSGLPPVPINNNNHRHPHYHRNVNLESPNYSPNGQVYSSQHITQQPDAYYQNEEASESHRDEVQERRTDELALKFLHMKSNGKAGNNYNNGKSLIIPRATTQALINNGKHGIILQDTIAVDDYNKEILELTNTWPKPLNSPTVGPLSTGIRPGGIPPYGGASQSFISHPVDLNNYHGHSQFASSFNAPNSHQQEGYAVNEETGDVPHDFRSMPIQTAPVQTNHQQPLPVGVQSAQNSNAFIHYQALGSNIHPQNQPVPGYYALAGLPKFVLLPSDANVHFPLDET